MAKLRIGLTISGAVSLGSYEGGALAALLTAVQTMGPDAVVVDAITGSSAGAITAVLAAQTLLRGLDPVAAMRASWVDLPSLQHLAWHGMESPLSPHTLSDAAKELLTQGGLPAGAPRQPDPVNVSVTLTSLAGSTYKIAALMRKTPVTATTYLDWGDFTFTSTSTDADYLAAAEFALASAANAFGFPPKLIERSEDDVTRMKANGVVDDLPPQGPIHRWYTDGGTVDDEPFGRLLNPVHDDDPRASRLLLMVHPSYDPPKKPGTPLSVWNDTSSQPRWTRTGLRAAKLQMTQSIYEDLRQLEKTNTRLLSIEDLAHAIDGAVTNDADRAALRAAIGEFLKDYETRKAKINEVVERRAPDAAHAQLAPTTSLGDALLDAIGRAAGLDHKRPATVEIVTPQLDPSGKAGDQLLAGEKLGHFFGFTADRLRRSDFALGWRNMRTFLKVGLVEHGVRDEVLAALPAVDAAYAALDWDGYQEGDATFGSLHLGEKLRLGLVGAHYAHVVEADVRHWSEGFPVSD